MQDGLLITAVVLSGLAFLTSAATFTIVVYSGKKVQVTVDEVVTEINAKKDIVGIELKRFATSLSEALK